MVGAAVEEFGLASFANVAPAGSRSETSNGWASRRHCSTTHGSSCSMNPPTHSTRPGSSSYGKPFAGGGTREQPCWYRAITSTRSPASPTVSASWTVARSSAHSNLPRLTSSVRSSPRCSRMTRLAHERLRNRNRNGDTQGSGLARLPYDQPAAGHRDCSADHQHGAGAAIRKRPDHRPARPVRPARGLASADECRDPDRRGGWAHRLRRGTQLDRRSRVRGRHDRGPVRSADQPWSDRVGEASRVRHLGFGDRRHPGARGRGGGHRPRIRSSRRSRPRLLGPDLHPHDALHADRDTCRLGIHARARSPLRDRVRCRHSRYSPGTGCSSIDRPQVQCGGSAVAHRPPARSS
jgi:hypothetical protein